MKTKQLGKLRLFHHPGRFGAWAIGGFRLGFRLGHQSVVSGCINLAAWIVVLIVAERRPNAVHSGCHHTQRLGTGRELD